MYDRSLVASVATAVIAGLGPAGRRHAVHALCDLTAERP
jgi:3-dehydroquinate dehydratase